MSSAIETRRAIAENCSNDFAVLMELAAVVKPADEFLKRNLEQINHQLETWKFHMQFEKPERYRKVERIIKNAEKNIRVAREKAIDIDHWLRFDLLDSARSC